MPPDEAPGHPEINRIVAPNPSPMTLQGTNTYVVGPVPGDGAAYVVDPGPDDEGHVERILEAAASQGGLAGYVLTHSHGDHAGAASRMGSEPLRAEDGKRAGPFEVVATPGHAEDHVCFLYGQVCFSGDLILGEGSSFVPPDGGSLAAYLSSLEKLEAVELELICPGHGPYVTDPGAKVRGYLDHRLERERKLLTALDAGERSRARLLDSAWDDVPTELRPAAAVVMEAHLQKLAAEDRLPAEPLTD